MDRALAGAVDGPSRGGRRLPQGAAAPFQQRYPVRLTSDQQRYLAVRRRAEAILAGVGLVVAALPMLVISAGVAATMGRPVLFTQDRITQDGRVFRLRKFRSMRPPAPGVEDDSDRLVPFGRLLRETSLDELPSLWNILVGDMSIVGPRPLTTDYLGRFSADQFTRHAVPAGLTGYAQVNGRNGLGWEERFAMDQEYVRRVRPALDLRILRDTVTTVLRRSGITDAGGVTMADFPGPQSTVDLVMEGPDESGAWRCVDRNGRTVLEGEAEVRGEVATVSLASEGPAGSTSHDRKDGAAAEFPARTSEPTPLDEALLLVASRLRCTDQVEWAYLDLAAEPSDALAAALERAGYATTESGARFATEERPPWDAERTVPRFLAFLGLPEESAVVAHRPTRAEEGRDDRHVHC